MVLVAALALGVLLGWLSGGRLAELKYVHLRGETPLVLLVFATALAPRLFELAPPFLHLPLRLTWAGGIAALAVLAFLNGRVPGVALIGLGLALNLAVVLANSGMPVAAEAVAALGRDPAEVLGAGRSVFHVGAHGSTRLFALGDLLPVPGTASSVVSLGDVLMLVGVAAFLVWAMGTPTHADGSGRPGMHADAAEA